VSKRLWALIAALVATSIYGVNHTVAKVLMPTYISPFALILLRVSGAGLLFWIIGFFRSKESIDKKDFLRIVGASIFGMVINMLFFFKGLSLSTPINSSVIVTISPILVFLLSAVLIREKITVLKSAGALLGLVGAISLVIFGPQISFNAPNIPLGNAFIFVNALSYGVYLIVVRPLTKKYSAITLMKYLFLVATIINLPICYAELTEVNWGSLPFDAIWRILFVVLATTFLTYLLNIFALKEISASTIGVFVYVQPVIAIAYSIAVGADVLDLYKAVAIVLVFIGVFMVSKNPAQKRSKSELL
jgi:drug/metabolite transporter (DMT)-like permease